MANTNGGTNDTNELSSDDGHTMDGVERDEDAEIDDDSDPGPAQDAGPGPSEEEADARTERLKFHLVKSTMDVDEVAEQLRATEPNIKARATALRQAKCFKFKCEDVKGPGGAPVPKAVSSDFNRKKFFEVMFGEGDTRPHIDLFKGRFVDWKGRLVDDRYSMMPMIDAMEFAGLEKQALTAVRQSFKEYIMLKQTNDLTLSFGTRVPVWDGVERMADKLIDLFAARPTETNKKVGKYFWLSIYNRITRPGCLAPIVLSLFGAQNAGKSRFSNELCRIIMNHKDASSVQLDLSANNLEFLREMTGNSVVANIGEMTGFTRGDLNKIKDFVTRTSDKMHYKYEGHFEQLRQWVSVLDGNKYEGLQRDDSGNRRFYPMFLGQLPDVDGQPAWQQDFEVDFEGFEDAFWQIMAECREWMIVEDLKGYNTMVRETAKAVFDFSESEMKADRGTIRDDNLDVFLRPALRISNGIALNRTKNKGWFIPTHEIVVKISVASRNRCDVKMNHLPNKLAVMGGESVMINNAKGYIFRNCLSKQEFLNFLDGRVGGDSADDKEITPDVSDDVRFAAGNLGVDASDGYEPLPF